MKIREGIKEFMFHCKYEKSLSEKTIKAYDSDLRQFVSFLIENKHSLSVERIDKLILKDILHDWSKHKAKTVKRKIASLKTLFKYLEFEDKISVNPFHKMRINIKEPKELPKVMDINEIEQILRIAYSTKNNIVDTKVYAYKESVRNIAILELLFATGMRVSELCNLKNKEIDLRTKVIIIKGKGNKERIVQIANKEALEALKAYFKLFKTHINKTGYFFINRLNHKLSDQSVRFMIKKYVASSNINKNITPHVFRHTFATLLLEEDVDIKYIQHLLGHSSIMTTQIYTHVNKEKQKQILIAHHPRKYIKAKAFI